MCGGGGSHIVSFYTTIFVEVWYRSEFVSFFFLKKKKYVSIVSTDLCVFFATTETELKSNDIIYARSFLSSLRINDFFFVSAGASHYSVCGCACEFVRIYRSIVLYQMESSVSETEWTRKNVITKKMVQNLYTIRKTCTYICLSAVYRELHR